MATPEGFGELPIPPVNGNRFVRESAVVRPIGSVATAEQADIGPGSILWRYAGDYRAILPALSHGILQLMHPAIGAGVAKHSNFYNDPANRIMRSIPEIIGTIYDEDGEATGHRVRDYHKHINGTDANGNRYDALNPETFWWAHATFVRNMMTTVDRYTSQTLLPSQREQLYQETNTWYSRYGVDTSPVPPTYGDFKHKTNQIIDEMLEMTPVAQRAVDMALSRDIDRLPGIPDSIWKVGKLPTAELIRLTTIGNLPEPTRQRFEIPWNEADEYRLRYLASSVRILWRTTSASQTRRARSFFPRARAGYIRTNTPYPNEIITPKPKKF